MFNFSFSLPQARKGKDKEIRREEAEEVAEEEAEEVPLSDMLAATLLKNTKIDPSPSVHEFLKGKKITTIQQLLDYISANKR